MSNMLLSGYLEFCQGLVLFFFFWSVIFHTKCVANLIHNNWRSRSNTTGNRTVVALRNNGEIARTKYGRIRPLLKYLKLSITLGFSFFHFGPFTISLNASDGDSNKAYIYIYIQEITTKHLVH